MTHEYEFIQHFEGLHFKTFLIHINHRLYHWHSDIELLLVMEGSVIVHTAQKQYELHKDDFFLLNGNEIHSLIRTKETNTLLALQFDPKLCKAYYPRLQRIRFIDKHIKTNECANTGKEIRACLTDLVLNYYIKGGGYQLKLMSVLNMMIYYLISHIQHEEIEEGMMLAEERNLVRLYRILNYIRENYANKISLKDIAANESLDMYYLSHFIKKQLGISFQEYLNKIRLEKAVELIAHTNEKLLDISLDCGFSDYRYLCKLFYKEYGCTPSHYKAEYKNLQPNLFNSSNREQHRVVDPHEAMEKLLQYLGQ